MNPDNGRFRPVTRLDQALRTWEEILFFVQAVYTSTPGDREAKENMVDAVVNWKSFRKSLLSRKPFDPNQFRVPRQVVKDYFLGSSMLEFLPPVIHSWSTQSLRVYNLSEDLQRSLELTSIGTVSWEDLTFPFPTFAIGLPIPLRCKISSFSESTDLLVVRKLEPGIFILCLGDGLDGRKFISPNMTDRISCAMADGRHGKIKKCLQELIDSPKDYMVVPPTQLFLHPTGRGHIMNDIDNITYERIVVGSDARTKITETAELDESMKLIMRIVSGLCLHLELVARRKQAKNAQPRSAWEKDADIRKRDPLAITDESLVCAVPCEHALTDYERAIHERIRELGIKQATADMIAYFRSGYWRRKPGAGDDDLAPRCVKVRWTMVNQNKLPENALPIGSAIALK